GSRSSAIAGRFWADVAEEFGLDPERRVAAALVRRDTWSGIEVDWPTDAGGAMTVRLAALPRFGDGRVFAGFRGVGGILGEAAARPEPEAQEDPQPLVEGGDQDVMFADPDERPTITQDEEDPDILHLQPARAVPPTGATLSDRERTAFSAIAEALGARWE